MIHWKRLAAATALAIGTVAAPAHAQLSVDVTDESASNLKIAVPVLRALTQGQPVAGLGGVWMRLAQDRAANRQGFFEQRL